MLVSVSGANLVGFFWGGGRRRAGARRRISTRVADRLLLCFFVFCLFAREKAVTLGEQRGGLTLEHFGRIVRCYLEDTDDAFRSD